MKSFGGPALFLDRSDINTDEIIPAKYLTEITKEDLKPYLLEDLKLPGFDPKSEKTKTAGVVVSRANFGCGSSREHAPWVFEVNGIYAVIAQSFARIFRQNMFNCGMVAIELSTVSGDGRKESMPFEISPFDQALVLAGGWVDYADGKY
jgi:3-isopropylmalate/(R)-2-methylmalate dehydratase small subunit